MFGLSTIRARVSTSIAYIIRVDLTVGGASTIIGLLDGGRSDPGDGERAGEDGEGGEDHCGEWRMMKETQKNR